MKSISGKKMCEVLGRAGWSLKRVSGSHYIFAKSGYDNISVPVHGNKTMNLGLQRSIMKHADIDESEL